MEGVNSFALPSRLAGINTGLSSRKSFLVLGCFVFVAFFYRSGAGSRISLFSVGINERPMPLVNHEAWVSIDLNR